MTEQGFVRSARAGDVAEVARIQVAGWRALYGDALPGDVLTELTGDDAVHTWERQWADSVERPPTEKHRLLVATAGDAVVGFAACGPASDEDLWPGTDGELYELHVAPGRTGEGHGSRLLNAVVDHLRDDGFTTVCTWVRDTDTVRRGFLESTGWAPDGVTRRLHLDETGPAGEPVEMIRLHTGIPEDA